jgi:hypothetical protein
MGPQRGALVGEVVVTVAPGCGMDKLRGQHRSARWRWQRDRLSSGITAAAAVSKATNSAVFSLRAAGSMWALPGVAVAKGPRRHVSAARFCGRASPSPVTCLSVMWAKMRRKAVVSVAVS